MKESLDEDLKRAEERLHYSCWFVLISCVFVTCLITANIISVKMVDIFGLILPAGIIIFPLSYIAGDVLTEVYGYAQARKVIWLGFFCNFVVVVAIWVAKIIPPALFWESQTAYETILGQTPRILAASFVAYLVGEFVNAFIMAKMKIATKGRWLWARTISSTLVGQGLDSMIFMSLAFVGIIPIKILALAVMTQWMIKSLYEALATPLTYAFTRFLKKHENMDVFDYRTRFNPFSSLTGHRRGV
ncbi:MAG: queuosine precursor transporter [Thermodesulfobacteriota bacterium]|nr:queuosine precursor transporter [Thermodesulfobacteriota bacterium]